VKIEKRDRSIQFCDEISDANISLRQYHISGADAMASTGFEKESFVQAFLCFAIGDR
jgi:hypothetical protein